MSRLYREADFAFFYSAIFVEFLFRNQIPQKMSNGNSLYIFIDEAGNFDFSANGTKYFCLSAVSCVRPFLWDLLEEDFNLDRFHASEDKQKIRDRVFQVIGEHIKRIRIDSLIVEKRKTQLHLQKIENFFPLMMGYLLKYVWEKCGGAGYKNIVVITDRIPVKKKRRAIEKAIKQTLAKVLPTGGRYYIYHHESASCFSLQVADYCNWAIYKKWEGQDLRSYCIIESGIKSEFDIFKTGTEHFY
jgi:hypothetical protein